MSQNKQKRNNILAIPLSDVAVVPVATLLIFIRYDTESIYSILIIPATSINDRMRFHDMLSTTCVFDRQVSLRPTRFVSISILNSISKKIRHEKCYFKILS